MSKPRVLVVLVGVLVVAVSFVTLFTPLGAAASDVHTLAGVTRYVVGDAVNCIDPASDMAEWNRTECWSTTSGGAGGASIPGPTDTAVFDTNSGFNPLFLVDNRSVGTIDARTFPVTHGLEPFWGTTLKVTNIFVGSGSGSYDIFTSFVNPFPTTTILFNGTIAGLVGSTELINLLQPPKVLRYNGSNAFGIISYIGLGNISNAGYKTIYCYPGCFDYGNNTNIVFGPPSPPIDPTVAAMQTMVAVVTVLLFVTLAPLVIYVAAVSGALGLVFDSFRRFEGGGKEKQSRERPERPAYQTSRGGRRQE